jgi:hypothetical protein
VAGPGIDEGHGKPVIAGPTIRHEDHGGILDDF